MKALFILLSTFLISSRIYAEDPSFVSEGQKFKVETLFKAQDVVWGFDFITPTEIVFTQRMGKIALFDLKTKKITELPGAPKVFNQGQGGLLDISVAPQDPKAAKKETKVFFAYSIPQGKTASTALGSAVIEGGRLTQVKKIFEAKADYTGDIQFGARIVWESPSILFLCIGDRDLRYDAQKLDNHRGKILRLTIEGKAAPGNPFATVKGALPEIWSYGHRNPEGLVKNKDGKLIEAEFGPRGGDEVNLIKAGANYGWPVITYGREYYGPKIGEGTAKVGMEQPLVYWVPSISPSGIDFYYGDKFPKWKGSLFLGALSGTHLHRVLFDKNYKVVKQEVLLDKLGWRIRDVQAGSDGYLYLSTDDGVLARLVPVQ